MARAPLLRRLKRCAVVSLLVSTAAVGTQAIWGNAALLTRVEGATLDWRFQLRGPREPSGDTKIVMIDDRTIAGLGWPVARDHLAAAVDVLSDAGARVIAFDLLFVETAEPQEPRPMPQQAQPIAEAALAEKADWQLARALGAFGAAVVPYAFAFQPDEVSAIGMPDAVRRSAFRIAHLPALPGPTSIHPAGLVAPATLLADAAETAHINVVLDADGALRHDRPALRYGESFYPSLAVETARLYAGLGKQEVSVWAGQAIRFGDTRIPTDAQMRLPVNHYGPPGTFETHSFRDVLNGAFPPDTFAGKVVLIGYNAIGVGDTFLTPYSRSFPGVEHFATVTDNILTGRFLSRPAWAGWSETGAALIGGILAATALALLPLTLAIVAVAVLAGSWAVATHLAFAGADMWLNVTLPTAAILLNGMVFGLWRSFTEARSRHRAERGLSNLSRYVAPQLAGPLAQVESPGFLDKTQYVAILFIDLIGFTERSESLPSAQVLKLLRRFHRIVEATVSAHGGAIDKYEGDGAMACFGLYRPSVTDAHHALSCALDLIHTLSDWQRDEQKEGGSPLQFGIGLHYGPVTLGVVGGDRQLQFTATGDTVNVASRLEGLTRTLDATIVASEALVEAVRADGGSARLTGFEPKPAQYVKGRAQPVNVWTLGRGAKPALAAPQA